MSLNKEMIFGLAFGDDDMKMVVFSSYEPQNFRSLVNNNSFVPSTPICITGINDIGEYDNITITYPDGSSMKVSGKYANNGSFSLPIQIYVPEGTKIDAPSATYVYYLPCKWVNV